MVPAFYYPGYPDIMFVLDRPFIGWHLPNMPAFGLGVFVMQYANAAKAELYLVLRRNVLESGICGSEDLMVRMEE